VNIDKNGRYIIKYDVVAIEYWVFKIEIDKIIFARDLAPIPGIDFQKRVSFLEINKLNEY
jgi:hypothetical protein